MAGRTRLNTPQKRARVGERIKLAATEAGFTLKALAESTGVKPTLIYQYVRGITAVPEDVLHRIATVTRVHPDFFDPDKDARATLALPVSEPVGEEGAELAADPGVRSRIYSEMRHLHHLAAAQKYPKPDRTAYVSSLNQMLALSRTVENRQQEGWILWMLGLARYDDGDLDDAKAKLLAARQLFASEGMAENGALVALDLARILGDQGAFETAESYLTAVLDDPDVKVRWRALISLGSLRFRQYDFPGALRLLADAAGQLEQTGEEQQEDEGMPLLITHLADVVRATGHPEQAMMLWGRCLQKAASDRKADWFLEALMEVARCCQQLGRMGEAKQRLELAVVLAGFLFEDESRLSVAKSLLADVLTEMGRVDEAKDLARSAQKVASKSNSARPTILSALALAEANLAAGQSNDALAHAQEAIDEAKRTKRTREVAQARELRARAYLRRHEDCLAGSNLNGAAEALTEAFREATSALDMAQRAESVRDSVMARVTLARCYLSRGDEAAAEPEIAEALRLISEGAVGLARLLGGSEAKMPPLLQSNELNLRALFADPRLEMPGLEWQALYLQGMLIAKQLGPERAFPTFREAAMVVSRMLTGLTREEAAAFQRSHKEVAAVFRDLERCAITDSSRRETAALIAGMEWMKAEGTAPALAPAR